MRRKLPIISAVYLVASLPAGAQQSMFDQVLDKNDGTRVEVRTVFDPPPPTGCAPVRVVVTNGSARDVTWALDFDSSTTQFRHQNSHRSSFGLQTSARKTSSAVFLVPLAVGYGEVSSYRYNQHNFRVKVSSSAHGENSGGDFDARATGLPAIAVSKSLADTNLTKLNDEVKSKSGSSGRSSGNAVFGSSYNPADLPEDWLAFSGFDYVMLTAADWETLKPGVRIALAQWVRFGGQLHVFVTTKTPAAIGLPNESAGGGTNETFSLGRIRKFNWDGTTLNPYETVSRYWTGKQRETDLLKGYDGTGGAWSLVKELGQRSFASWQVLVFLFVFGVLVGPVNLYVFAPPGKRHKLFFTTPLLSVSASVLMIGLILFQDGTGGMGRRMITIDIEPGETSAYVTQEQISRTGVLLSSGFEVAQPALVEPLALPETGWTKLRNDNQSQPVNLSQRGRLRSGNYFQSRTEQAQAIRTAVPTRARLELKSGIAADAPPAMISALGFTVDSLFYVDAKGAVWKSSAPLVTGRQATLAASSMKELESGWSALTTSTGKALRDKLNDLPASARGCFFASARQAPGFTQETLPSIRWKDDKVAVFGTVAKP